MNTNHQTKMIPTNLQNHTYVCTRLIRKIENIDDRTDKPAPGNIKIMTNELKESKIIQYFQHLPKPYLHPVTNSG